MCLDAMIGNFGSNHTSGVMDIPNVMMSQMRIRLSARLAQILKGFPTEIPSAPRISRIEQLMFVCTGTPMAPSAQFLATQ